MNNIALNMRARVVDVLYLLSSRDAQEKLSRDVPSLDVSGELFNQWEDCYFPEDGVFVSGFSTVELVALRRFDNIWNQVASATPQVLPPWKEFVDTPEWSRLALAAREALAVLLESSREK